MTIQDYLLKTAQFLGLDDTKIKIEIDENEQRKRVNIVVPQEMEEKFVGLADSNIRALQHLIRATFTKKEDGQKITLDVNSRLKKQEDQFLQEVKTDALKVLETTEPKIYKNLNSYERYLIHTTIGEDSELEELITSSQTVGMQRWLTIEKKATDEK